MIRCIDADLLRKNMAELKEHERKYLQTHEVFNTIWDAPTADVRENVRGEWIVKGGEVVCSKCFEPNLETNFCPNCGADMRGVKE